MTDTPRITIELYRGKKRLRQAWRWRAIAPNGRIIATSGEAYTNYDDMLRIVETLFPRSLYNINVK